jgi:hypothetical protein
MMESKMLSIKPWQLFVMNFEISIACGLAKRRSMCGKLRIFKHGREFRSERFKHYKLWALPRRLSSEAGEGMYRKLVKI